MIELAYYQTIVDDKLPMKIVKAELQNLIKAVEAERYNSSKCQMQTLVIQPGCKCQNCGENYTVDLNIPDELWKQIKPINMSKSTGLLCGKCIMENIEKIKGFASYELMDV
uniref:Uncharacterized protein n=1 Tax=viral metagenome TaxID=1070528 RepID=A0A6M3KVY4_9ZZZZ